MNLCLYQESLMRLILISLFLLPCTLLSMQPTVLLKDLNTAKRIRKNFFEINHLGKIYTSHLIRQTLQINDKQAGTTCSITFNDQDYLDGEKDPRLVDLELFDVSVPDSNLITFTFYYPPTKEHMELKWNVNTKNFSWVVRTPTKQ